MRLKAYYYSFEPTGNPDVDRILSAVACAGKAFHHTDQWGDEENGDHWGHIGANPVEWIQNAANEAAKTVEQARREGAAAMKERAAQVAEKSQAEVDRRNQRRPSTYLDSVSGDDIASAIRALGEDA